MDKSKVARFYGPQCIFLIVHDLMTGSWSWCGDVGQTRGCKDRHC